MSVSATVQIKNTIHQPLLFLKLLATNTNKNKYKGAQVLPFRSQGIMLSKKAFDHCRLISLNSERSASTRLVITDKKKIVNICTKVTFTVYQ